ncbi:MAG TPA: HupE/UreJ family protein, partial [Sulfurovum sp.]|nr:HupE/UreJ family protein [Sulfurovum sp.]
MKNNQMIRLLLIISFLSTYLLAHTVKPAYLEIKSIGEHTYATKWKVPLQDAKNPSIYPLFPSFCQENITNTHNDLNLIFIASTLQCKETLIGKSISIQNIENDSRTVIFHFEENRTSYFTEFNPTHPSLKITSTTQHSQNTFNYISLGIKHILLGYDHLLFVLGLLLLIRKSKTLIQTITAFTSAHSITLGASTLGYVSVSEIFIEMMIALSIIILAVEIIYVQRGKIGLSSKYPWGVALFFGLIHGFGFASVLSELSLPEEHFVLALLFFNLGIELGQILFISFLISLYYLSKIYIRDKYLSKGKVLIPYIIGSIASYLLIERFIKSFN